MKNLLNLTIIAALGLFVVLGCSADNSKQTAPKNEATAPKAETPAPAEVVSNIKWEDYNKIYNTKSTATDMQKDAQWKDFEGQTVFWKGTVSDVSEGVLGGLNLTVKMDANTLTSDVLLSLKDDQKSKAMNLTKGSKVSFTGKMKSYGGAFLPLTIDNGEIK